jgi:hypothetical protein
MLADGDRPEVMIMADTVRAVCRPARRLARLFIVPNKLRRPSDRIEGAVVVLLSAMFLAAVAAAPWLGVRVYQSQRAGTAGLRPAVAVLTQAGPANGLLVTSGEAVARWRAPDGERRSGWLTTSTAPGIWGAPAGGRVRVWLTRSGVPEDPPSGPWQVGFASVIMAIGAACCSGIVLFICYWLCRLALDRQRLDAWASEWSVAGPRWTTRRLSRTSRGPAPGAVAPHQHAAGLVGSPDDEGERRDGSQLGGVRAAVPRTPCTSVADNAD